MAESMTAYLIGRFKLGEALRSKTPEAYADRLLKEFPQIEEVNVITGVWDVLIRFRVKDMDEYYHTAWGIAKSLQRGYGMFVAKKFTR